MQCVELELEGENGDRRGGDAQEAVWTSQLEMRAEGRNTRNTSAPSVEEEVVVLFHITHKCS